MEFAGTDVRQALREERTKLIKELKSLNSIVDICHVVDMIMDYSYAIAELNPAS